MTLYYILASLFAFLVFIMKITINKFVILELLLKVIAKLGGLYVMIYSVYQLMKLWNILK